MLKASLQTYNSDGLPELTWEPCSVCQFWRCADHIWHRWTPQQCSSGSRLQLRWPGPGSSLGCPPAPFRIFSENKHQTWKTCTFHRMLPLLWTKNVFIWRIIFIYWQRFRFLTFPKPPWAWPILKTQGNLSWARICNFTPFGTWSQNRNTFFCRSFFSMNEACCEGFAEANALLLKLILQIGTLCTHLQMK